MMKVDEFLKMVRKAVELKSLYVMGGWGFPLTDSNKERTQKNEYNRRAARKKKIDAASADTFAWDCVGLTKGVLWGWTGDASKKNGGASYAANGVPDWDAKEMMFKGCKDPTTDFSKIEPGEFLWLDGHCGVYLGDGLAAESTPSWKDGAQITAVSNLGSKAGYNKRKWTYHGHLKFVDYDTAPSKYPTPPFKITVEARELVRKGPYSDTEKVGYLQPGVYTVTEVGGSSGDYGKVEMGWVYLPDVTIGENPKTLDGYTVGETYEVICLEPLNVRTKAEVSDSAEIITTLTKNSRVTAKALTRDSEGNTWMRISVPVEGWICCIYHGEKYVGDIEESMDGYTVGKVYTVDAKAGLRLRLSPSTAAVTLKVLPYKTRITCVGLKSIAGNTWMQIQGGWVAAHYNGSRYVV